MIEVALIGKGRWGKNYINTIAQMAEVNLPAENIRTRDYKQLFDKREINGVIIASSSDTHYQIARDFMVRNFNLLIEKPITTTLQEAIALQRLNNEHKVTVVVGHIQIYDPGYIELKKSLGRIGTIQKMIFKGLQSPPRQDSTELENWGPHPIYLFLDIAGRKPKHVSTSMAKNNNVRLEFDFGDELLGIADFGSIHQEKERELTVIGTEGSLTFDWSGPVKKLSFRDKEGNETDIPFDTNRSPLELEVLEFVNCIETGKTPRTPLSQGVEVMRIIEEAQK